MSTSATGGYLSPNATPAPLNGGPLVDFLQEILSALTGMDGTLVRPRWQAEPPVIPPAATSWAAIGVTTQKSDTFPYLGLDSDANYQLRRHQELMLMCSFYDLGDSGDADLYANLARDNFVVPQNREALAAGGFALVEVGDIVNAPTLLNNRWQNRLDLSLRFRRQIRREYPVLTLLGVSGTVAVAGPQGLVENATF